MTRPIISAPMGRRGFLRRAGVVGATLPIAGGLLVGACYNDPTGGRTERPSGVPANSVKPGPLPEGGAAALVSQTDSHAKIDLDHKKGIEEFLKNQKTPITKGKGMQPLAPRLENGVKVFDLTADEVDWEVSPGLVEKGRGFNGMIPGPTLRATEGDTVRINLKNNLTESTSIHWHGIFVPNAMDGVPYLTQEPVKPGETFTYEFTLRFFVNASFT